MKIHAKFILILVTIFGAVLASCEAEKNSLLAQEIMVAEILQDGRPAGIIGSIDLEKIPLSEFPEVNIIQMVDTKAKNTVAQGNATRLRNFVEKKDYVLTVAHLFQNVDVDHKVTKLYIGKNGKFEGGDWFHFSKAIHSINSPHKFDLILIPVNYDATAAAFDIDKTFTLNHQLIPSKISIVSILNLKNTPQIHKVKQTAQLRDEFMLAGTKLLRTDADLITGLSGSPVFNANGEIIGLVSRISRFKKCREYKKILCSNVIFPITKSWISSEKIRMDNIKIFINRIK